MTGCEEHSAGMADHMARAQRRNRGALLLVALGIGLMAFTVVDANSGHDSLDTSSPDTSSPTVLGAVVTRPADAPTAAAASPAPLELPSATTAGRSPARDTTRTTVLPQIGEALTIDNPNPVTTTTSTSTSTTTESTTTTTEPETTTTPAP